jgi:hypothetical protein
VDENIDLNSEDADSLKVHVELTGIEEYERCRQCFDGECKDCVHVLDKSVELANFLRPRMPFPNL